MTGADIALRSYRQCREQAGRTTDVALSIAVQVTAEDRHVDDQELGAAVRALVEAARADDQADAAAAAAEQAAWELKQAELHARVDAMAAREQVSA